MDYLQSYGIKRSLLSCMDESNRKAKVIDPALKKVEKAAAQRVLARHLYNEGKTNKEIGETVGVHEGTIRKWFREEGLPSGVARKLHVKALRNERMLAESPPPTPPAEVTPPSEIVEFNPEQQVSPADRYQQFVAGEGMRIMQEALPTLQKPRNVKELGELDQIIRRNLGLNAKSAGGAGGRLSIDISILSGKKPNPNKTIIDVEADEYPES